MNRYRLFLSGCFSLLFCLSANAQVTLNSGDMPAPGDLLRYSISDTLPGLAGVEAAVGTGNTWDFSYLNPAAQRTDSFVSISAVPVTIRFFFPFTANLALYVETPDSIGGFGLSGGFQLFENTSGAYKNLGFGGTLSGIPISLPNNPTDTVLTFPLQFGATGTSVAKAKLDVPNLVYYEQERYRTWEADADGQLTTPFGTFPAVRVHSDITGRDSLALDTIQIGFNVPVQEAYDWYSPDQPGSLLSLNVTGQDSVIRIVSGATYADSLRDVFQIGLALADERPEPIGLYPNPAQDRVQVDLPTSGHLHDARMDIYSLDGRLMWQGPLLSPSVSVQLPELASGVYQVMIEASGKRYQGRLMIE